MSDEPSEREMARRVYGGAARIDVPVVAMETVHSETKATIGYTIFCPACQCGHLFTTVRQHEGGPQWNFNGDRMKPTFTPSMLATSQGRTHKYICHSYVTDGRIQFLSDCTHAMANQTVDLEPF